MLRPSLKNLLELRVQRTGDETGQRGDDDGSSESRFFSAFWINDYNLIL